MALRARKVSGALEKRAPDVCFAMSDRSARLKEMQERQEELQLNNKRLQQEEQHLREKYHEVHSVTCL